MKLKVLKAFKDKNTKELYKVGTEIEVSDERGAELLEHPMKLVEEVKEAKTKTVRKKKSGK